MNTPLLVYLINFLSLIIAVAQLCISSSIFDFIVTNRMFYTAHNEEALIDPEHASLYFAAPLISALLSLLTLLIPQCPSSVHAALGRHPFPAALLHATVLGGCSLLFALCAYCSGNVAGSLSHFAFNGTPQKFADASLWYFIRLRASTALFSVQSVFCLTEIGLLYLGIECRYRLLSPQEKASA